MYGANLALWYLIQDIRDRYGVIPSVLAPQDGEFPEICRKNNIEVFCLKFCQWCSALRFRSKAKGLAKYILNRLIRQRKLVNELRHKHFNIIHTNSSVIDTGSFIAKHFSLPHVWHIREYGADDYNIDYVIPRSCVRAEYSQSCAIIAISEAIYDSFVDERSLCPKDSTRVIYNGLKIPASYSKRQPGKILHFCMTGLLYSGKNQLTAIHACAKLKALTDNFMLHVIGTTSGEYYHQLRQAVTSLGLDKHIKFWGYRSDVDDILHDMDIGLMLSNREAFGRVTVEYMLNYMPVIGVDTGATPEIVIDGENGCIVPLNDADKLAQVMYEFIKHPELIPAMGNKGRERAVKNFSLERNTDEIYALYQEILRPQNFAG